MPATPEVFDHDCAVGAYQASGELVQAVAARVRDGGVQAGDAGLGVAPPRRGDLPGPPIRTDTAGRLTLQPAKFPLHNLQMPRIGNHLTGREHRQRLDPEVDTHQRPRPDTARPRSGRARVIAGDLHDGERAPASDLP
jgi:hypothetical protein